MAPFATVEDVAARVGRELTTAEEGQVDLGLRFIASLIRGVIGADDDYLPDPVPELFFSLSVEKVARLVYNPKGLRAESKDLGEASYSRTYDTPVGLTLTEDEVRLIRRSVDPGAGYGNIVVRGILV